MMGVGRDLCRSSSPAPSTAKVGSPTAGCTDHVQEGFDWKISTLLISQSLKYMQNLQACMLNIKRCLILLKWHYYKATSAYSSFKEKKKGHRNENTELKLSVALIAPPKNILHTIYTFVTHEGQSNYRPQQQRAQLFLNRKSRPQSYRSRP